MLTHFPGTYFLDSPLSLFFLSNYDVRIPLRHPRATAAQAEAFAAKAAEAESFTKLKISAKSASTQVSRIPTYISAKFLAPPTPPKFLKEFRETLVKGKP